MKIKAENIELVDISSIVENPKNPNSHPKDQIKRLSKLIKNTGFRNPLVVSKKSGFLVVGHGRLAAAKALKMEKVPVIFQDFDNEAEEYAYMTADNAIGSWSELDLEQIKLEIEGFKDFDIEMLGIESFETKEEKEKEEKEKEEKEVDVDFLYKIEVDCMTEENQQMLMGELHDRGFAVRVLI